MEDIEQATGRRLGVGGLIGVFVVYIALIQTVTLVASRNLDDVEFAGFYDTRTTWLVGTLAVLCSVVFVAIVTTVLGWWKPVLIDRHPVQRWVWLLVVVMLVAIGAGTNYPALADITRGHLALLVTTVLLIGVGEEIMFRGLAVTTFRQLGWSETKVLVASSALFGLAHASNVILSGPQAALQVVVTVWAGVFFHLFRRVSGGLVVPIVMHALWDLGAMSSEIVRDEVYGGAVVFIVADIAMAAIVWRRRRRIESTTVA